MTLTAADLVHAYLQKIGLIPQLTRNQEILYGRQVQHLQALYKVANALADQLGQYPTLEQWVKQVEISLGGNYPKSVPQLQQAIAQGETAKRKMMEANLRLVVAVAKRYTDSYIELLDLIQEGTIGLQQAVEKFNPMWGYRFSTYAYCRIHQAVTRALAQPSRTITLPLNATNARKMKKLPNEQLFNLYFTGYQPKPGQICSLFPSLTTMSPFRPIAVLPNVLNRQI